MNDDIELANKVEAILIATPHPLSKKEITNRMQVDESSINKAFRTLQKRYNNTALELKNYGKKYKIVVREAYSELSYMFSELELTKGEMEILAYAFKNKKMYLSEIRRLRGPKTIEEISHLEKLGYVKLEKKGRYNILKLTKTFIKKFGKEIEKELKEVKKDESVSSQVPSNPDEKPIMDPPQDNKDGGEGN